MKSAILISLLASSFSCWCQNLDFYGVFPVLSNTQVINSKFDVNLLAASKISAIERTIDHVTYPARNLEIYFQSQLSYKINSRIMAGAAYGFQRNNPFEANYTHEHRFGQQIILSAPIKKALVYQRLRFEERLIQKPESKNGYVSGTRVRYQIGMMKPLGNNSRMYFNLSNELFFISSGPRNSFIAEDMTYAGVGKKMTKSSNVEIGIVYNPTVRNLTGDLRNLFLIQLMWSSSTHWRGAPHHALLHFRHF